MLALIVRNIGGGSGELGAPEAIRDYDWRVEVNGRVIAHGQVNGHKRSDGWPALVRRIADAQEETAS